MKKTIRILSLTLALVLTLTALALPTMAAAGSYSDNGNYDDAYYDEEPGYYYDDTDDDQVAAVFFWILLILMGNLVPIGLIAVGLILPNIKKLGRPKYWYALAVSGGVWLVIALFIILMLIII
jgi:hypothetical protein